MQRVRLTLTKRLKLKQTKNLEYNKTFKNKTNLT